MKDTTAKPMRVLVVDDNRDAADSLRCLLELSGYDVRVAYDGVAGLLMAQLFVPDCLLADIHMPRLDGFGLARNIRAEAGLQSVKLVALSSITDDAQIRKVTESGFDYRLTKGCDPSKVLEVLEMIREIKLLALKTQELAQQNVDLAGQTKELLREVREDVREVKHEVQELKQEVRDLKQDHQQSHHQGEAGNPSGS